MCPFVEKDIKEKSFFEVCSIIHLDCRRNNFTKIDPLHFRRECYNKASVEFPRLYQF